MRASLFQRYQSIVLYTDQWDQNSIKWIFPEFTTSLPCMKLCWKAMIHTHASYWLDTLTGVNLQFCLCNMILVKSLRKWHVHENGEFCLRFWYQNQSQLCFTSIFMIKQKICISELISISQKIDIDYTFM